MYYFFLLIGIINFLFIYYYNKISIIYNLFDHPNEERKKQREKCQKLRMGMVSGILNLFYDKWDKSKLIKEMG